jgi:NADPH2:quinone reductase
MKAMMVTRLGGPEVLELQEVPPPQPKENEVLINVEAAGVNFADLLATEGRYGAGPVPPYVPGREFSGTVAATGERVMGYCELGAFAGQIALTRDRVWPWPPQFTPVQAAAFPVNYFTAFFAYWQAGLVERQPDHELRFPGGRRPRVLIHAVGGGVGTAAVQIGALLGVETFGTASTDSKIQGAFALGLDHGIVYTRQDYEQLILEYTNGEGVDAVFEMLGGDETARSIRTMGFLGRCILYGAASGKPARFNPRHLYAKSQSAWGLWLTWMATRPEPMKMAARRLTDWVSAGKLKPVVGRVLPLEDAAEALRFLGDRKSFGKIVLQVGPPR